MSFTTFLQSAGNDLKKVLTFILPIAEAAEPFIAIAEPAIAPLYATTVNLIIKAEGAAAVAGQQSGTGPQKLSYVISALQPIATAYLQSVGVPAPTTAQITAWINACVAGLNAYGALSTVPVPAAVLVPTITTVGASQVTVTEKK